MGLDNKLLCNQTKHGISFEAAQDLWNDADAVKLEAEEN